MCYSTEFPWNLAHFRNATVKSRIFSRELGWSLVTTIQIFIFSKQLNPLFFSCSNATHTRSPLSTSNNLRQNCFQQTVCVVNPIKSSFQITSSQFTFVTRCTINCKFEPESNFIASDRRLLPVTILVQVSEDKTHIYKPTKSHRKGHKGKLIMIWAAAENPLCWHWPRLIITATVNITQRTFGRLPCLSLIWHQFSFRHTQTTTSRWLPRCHGATCVTACCRDTDSTDGTAPALRSWPLLSSHRLYCRLYRRCTIAINAASWWDRRRLWMRVRPQSTQRATRLERNSAPQRTYRPQPRVSCNFVYVRVRLMTSVTAMCCTFQCC